MPRAYPRSKLPLILVVMSSSCALIGGLFGGGGKRAAKSPAAVDSIEAYEAGGTANPARLAKLHYVRVRRALKPSFSRDALFSSSPGGEPGGKLASGVELVFSGAKDGWFQLEATRIAPPTDGTEFSMFATAEGPLVRTASGDGLVVIGSREPAGVPLVRTDSFDAHFKAPAGRGDLQLCFFSKSPTACDGGYEFSTSEGRFQYMLRRLSDGKTYCSYKLNEHNILEAQSLTLDAQKRKKDPVIDVSAHNGFISVTYNGQHICGAQGEQFSPGYFLVGKSGSFTEFSIDLNAGSEPIYADPNGLTGVEVMDVPPEKSGSEYSAYNAFVADLQAFQSAKEAGGEASFQNSYFTMLLGGGEADEAYEAAKAKGTIAALLAYLEAHPVNPHKRAVEKAVLELALDSRDPADAETFISAFPDSKDKLIAEEHRERIIWTAAVGEKPSKKTYRAYLKENPKGLFGPRAQLMLDSFAYRKANKAEVDQSARVRAEAQKIVNKSSVSIEWGVEILDFFDGNIFFNLNDSPHGKQSTGVGQINYVRAQYKAVEDICGLLKKRISDIESCDALTHDADAQKRKGQRMDAPVLEHYAIKAAIEKYYVPRLKRGIEFDRVRLVELLDRMRGIGDEHFRDWAWMAHKYAQLGLVEEGAFVFYEFARNAKTPSGVSSAHRYAIKKHKSPLLGNERYKWVLANFGE